MSKDFILRDKDSVQKIIYENSGLFEKLKEFPISAIEGATNLFKSKISGACACNCIGCSANATLPNKNTYYLSPSMLKKILSFINVLKENKINAISTRRINLFSGSNELDHPHCISLRESLSNFYIKNFGYPLGKVSSDIIFHISNTNLFKENLSKLLEKPYLFDNICFSIDEQIPFKNQKEYDAYLRTLNWTWKTLEPVINNRILHYNREKSNNARLIINFLLPNKGFFYAKKFKYLYPDGPLRATTKTQLIERYISPYISKLDFLEEPIPGHHVFTTQMAKFKTYPKSKVFISASSFEPVGRAKKVLNTNFQFPSISLNETIRSKILPISDSAFKIKIVRSPSIYSDGVLLWNKKPDWVKEFDDITFSF